MPIVFNWVGSGPGLQRWQNALAAARTTNAFNALEAKLIAEGTTHVTINVVESFLGQLSQTFVEAANPATLTINLHPTNAIYVDHADGTRGPVLDAATFGHGLAHLTADRVPGANAFDTREERRVIEIEDAIAFDLGGSKRADLSFWGKLLESVGAAVYPGSPDVNKCFAPGTPILLADGTTKPIEDIQVDDLVLAFDDQVERGRGALQPHRVIRLFQNVTDEWLELSPIPDQKGTASVAGFFSLTVTPGHRFLKADGRFEAIGTIIERAKDEGVDVEIILANGTPIAIQAKHILRSEETASLYDNGMVVDTPTVSSLALKPRALTGWRSYNFEVEELNTYVAGGIRVHNESKLSLVAAAQQFDGLFDHKFDGSSADVGLLMGAIVDGRITAYQNYTSLLSDDRYAASAYDFIQNKIIISANELGYTISNVHEMGNGVRTYQVDDISNAYNWNREVVAVHPEFIDRIVVNDDGTVGLATWYGATLAGDIGGALGSSLGRLLGSNSLVGQVAAGTVIGTIGKEIGNALTYGGVYTLDVAVNDAFGTLNGGSNIGALPGAAIGALSSLAIAELADALGLDGFEGGVFTTAGTTITTQLVTNAFGMMTGATWGSGNAYTLFTGFDPATIAGNLGPSVGLQLSGVVGGYLGQTLAAHVMVPHYAEGAIGQQVGSSVGGAIGAFLLAPIPVVGPILGSFLGSFVGGVLGSFAGDAFGADPVSQGRMGFAADHRFYADPHSFVSANGATGETFMHIATYTANTVNALADFAGVQMNAEVVTTGFLMPVQHGLQLRYDQETRNFWITEKNTPGFVALAQNVDSEDDMASLATNGIMTLTDRVTVTGGDPLVRLAWVNSTAKSPSAFAFDLQVAKDYRSYLDDKAMIDLMMAAAPESAFTAGWILTLLKARELGLDAQPANNDFRAGNDVLNGTAGADLLIGGGGFDMIHGGEGNDRIDGGADGNWLFGEGGNDILIGGTGNDSIDGGTGDDALDGRAGDDALYGEDGHDTLRGGAGNDGLVGGAGDDHLDGGDGNDTLNGGAGNDTYQVDSAGDVVTEYADQGHDTVIASVSYTLAANVENLVLVEGAATDGAGNALDNTITGNSNDNWLDGSYGNDRLIGGAGNDSYHVNSQADVVIEHANAGTDTIHTWVNTTLPDNVENLVLLEGAVAPAGTGNGGNNTITGNSNSNGLSGGAGDDILIGGGGGDVAIFSGNRSRYQVSKLANGDILVADLRSGANDGTDTVRQVEAFSFADGTFTAAEVVIGLNTVMGGSGNDDLAGGAGDDLVAGGSGNDTLAGNAGNDVLLGEAGTDTAVFHGNRAASKLSSFGNGIVRVSGPDGFDVLAGIERLQFDDVTVAPPATMFDPMTFKLAAFGETAGWTSDNLYTRDLADVNGDGMADILGFGSVGWRSLATGGGNFAPMTLGTSDFGVNGGWTSDDRNPRELADVNGDGMADILGFGTAGVWVALATGGGNFAPMQLKYGDFGLNGGWTSDDRNPREVADVNGDGMADILGFGTAGVWVALATGGGNFAPMELRYGDFGLNGGWTSDDWVPRKVGDVNGDGMADILGFGTAGVWVALATGGGNFAPMELKFGDFGLNGGWTSDDRNPRELADVNGDGMADILGFGTAGVWVALATGDGNFGPMALEYGDFGLNGGWSSDDRYPRKVADVNGDGLADIVGFGSGVWVALANGFHIV
jgi:Ca2+-binding RTX toxin-like protein